MGILDGIVEWIAEQVMNILDLITTSVLGALGCSMDTFLRYFPAAETMYDVFLALALGLILLNWVWQLFKNYFMGAAAVLFREQARFSRAFQDVTEPVRDFPVSVLSVICHYIKPFHLLTSQCLKGFCHNHFHIYFILQSRRCRDQSHV